MIITLVVFIIGTAGSGKSLLTAAYSNWLKIGKQKVITLNLDPGVLKLPYFPDVDVRNLFKIEEIMEKYTLGPNGALIMAADLIAGDIKTLADEITDFNPDILLVDTPGQMELFAFRASGPYIVQALTGETGVIVYLFDSVFSHNPLNYVSNLFLSAAVFNRFFMPQVHVLSKCDLLKGQEVDHILDWAAKPGALETEIEEKLRGTRRILSRDMMHAIYRLDLGFLMMPVSAKTNEGLINFNSVLERISTRGEKFTL